MSDKLKSKDRSHTGVLMPVEMQERRKNEIAKIDEAWLANSNRVEAVKERWLNKSPAEILLELVYETKAMSETYLETKGGRMDYNVLQAQKVLGDMISKLPKIVKEDKLDNENEVIAEIEKIKRSVGLTKLEKKMSK